MYVVNLGDHGTFEFPLYSRSEANDARFQAIFEALRDASIERGYYSEYGMSVAFKTVTTSSDVLETWTPPITP